VPNGRQNWSKGKGGCKQHFVDVLYRWYLVDKTTRVCTQRLPASECHLPCALCTVDFIRIVGVCINVFYV